MQTYIGIEDYNLCATEFDNSQNTPMKQRRKISWKNIIQTTCVWTL